MNRLRQGCALAVSLVLSLAAACAQNSFLDQNSAASVSGQFLVTGVQGDSPLFRNPALAANTNLIRLKPALLAVAAERFKIALWQQLGLPANSSWSGKIYLQLLPARTLDQTVTITASPFLDHWNYGVGMPDILSKTRYARAMSGVLLLELANRSAQRGGHSAELPAWLVDGIALQLLAAEGAQLVLSAPLKKTDDLAVGRINQSERGFDPFAASRPILQSLPALTFDQLSWPTDAQMNGADGGAYFASAQLFQSELLALKNGREKMRALLAELPAHLNWQIAFFHAFGRDFQGPLDVEKWWALRVVNFAARAPGPRWTTDVSLLRMRELMSVPVEFRTDSNALPAHAEISLQDALKNLGPAQREMVLQTKIRDFELLELRLAAPFGGLADNYRMVLVNFLSDSHKNTRPSVISKHGVPINHQVNLADTLKKLDALDRRRRDAETGMAINLQKPTQSGTPGANPAQPQP